MKKISLLALALFAALLSCSLVRLGQAGTISVGTYDPTADPPMPRDFFHGGEDVRVIATSSDKPITITVTDPDGTVVHSETYDGYEYDDVLADVTEKSGWHTVEASSPIDTVRKNYACTYFNVIPEVPLAILGAGTMMLLGLGFYVVVQRKKCDM